MGTEVIEPQAIRNVTIIGTPEETARIVYRLTRRLAETGSDPATVPWMMDRIDHTIRLTELSSHAPIATLERSIRVADGVIAVMNAAARHTPLLETILRVADDHQVARLCLVTGLDHPAADFDRCIHTIADTHGAVPLPLQIPHGIGPEFEGVIDLIPMWALEPMAAEFYGRQWKVAEKWHRELVATALEQDPEAANSTRGPREIPPAQVYDRVRHLTHIGEAVPVLCDAAPWSDIAPLLDAVIRYLPSPMHVYQPEHALDY